MKVEMGEEGLNILDMSRDQAGLLVEALKASPKQGFMEDEELRRLFKLLAVVQSDLWDDMTSGKFDFSAYKRQ
ncbi:hypothetical protein Tgr7_1130 [Thioalkalivibrio sulfidiphilus HL-EbGr7]|uniref:Uncharacterized protein n=1 Tax=Thioalkalivibrio sulfidiphilus (strain HL-EbGR7) TaxID=396588 RepID=B8GPP9_THISH|nr:hypothetical protein [Thioalkalivibrio sulfidiphilus]ACL72216.1 hypothetical protein Tgr7_1130 [Thioalkalivibrio sulfidiphilus HL-EbGr7]